MKKMIFCLAFFLLGGSSNLFAEGWGSEDPPDDCDGYVTPDPYYYTQGQHTDGGHLIETDCVTYYADCYGNGAGNYCWDTDLGEVDCNGDLNGSAYIDNCNHCVGGNTNKEPCIPCDNPVYNPNDVSTEKEEGSYRHVLQNNEYGYTDDEYINFDISACSNGSAWTVVLTSMTGFCSERPRLIPGVSEIQGTIPDEAHFCKQITDLQNLGNGAAEWYAVSAVKAHEDVHLGHMQPALVLAAANIEGLIESIYTQDVGQSQDDAINQIKNSLGFLAAREQARSIWDDQYNLLAVDDHDAGGPVIKQNLMLLIQL